ncbi:peptidoglycan-associated outer membrane lipoprotein Pal [Gammaproteobacteria bacterium]
MKTFRLLAIVIVSCCVGALTACSHFKSGGSQDGAQALGMGDQDGFADENSLNRLKAPYNQVYHFGFDKYDVNQDDIASINVQAGYLIAHTGAKVRLEGNADERGSREYNIALGWKRAKAVAAILKQQGVGDAQIAVVSYGKEKPVAVGHDESAYSQNRRVDLVYEAK